MDRFPGLLLNGYVTEDFSKALPVSKITQEQDINLKRTIASLNYYKQNHIKELKYNIDKEFWGFKGKERQRSLRSFTIISKYLAEYSETEQEFIQWCEILNKTRTDYQDMINEEEPVVIEEWVDKR